MSTLALPGSIRDTGIVMARELRPVLADPFSLIFGHDPAADLPRPFGPLLAGSVSVAIGGSVWQWFVSSILVMTALFGTSATGANLLFEFQTGAHERRLVTPLSRRSLLIGRSLKEMVQLGGQALVIILAMLPFGFQLFPVGALIGLLLLVVFGVGLGSLSYALAIAVRKQWMFWAVQQALPYPLMILSGMLLPLESGPGWMRFLAAFNPIAHLVDAERALFTGQFTADVGWGWLAAIATAAVGLTIGIRAIVRGRGLDSRDEEQVPHMSSRM